MYSTAVKHSAMTHCDAVVYCDCIELCGKAALAFNLFLDQLADLVQMDVSGDKLGE